MSKKKHPPHLKLLKPVKTLKKNEPSGSKSPESQVVNISLKQQEKTEKQMAGFVRDIVKAKKDQAKEKQKRVIQEKAKVKKAKKLSLDAERKAKKQQEKDKKQKSHKTKLFHLDFTHQETNKDIHQDPSNHS